MAISEEFFWLSGAWDPEESADLSSSFTVQHSGSAALSSSITIENKGSRNLSSNVVIQNADSKDLSSNLFASSLNVNLSSNLTVQNIGYKDLSGSFTVRKADSKSLSSSVFIRNWLPGWKYRKSHIINAAAGAGTDYQVRITVYYGSGTDSGGSVYCRNKCKTDFGDIRFTKDDGATLLNYWMESKTDSSQAIFWIRIPDDLSSINRTFYLYYGNNAATTTSSGVNTFPDFFDDIESGTEAKWNDDDAMWSPNTAQKWQGSYSLYGYDNSTTKGGSLRPKPDGSVVTISKGNIVHWARFGENNLYHFPYFPSGSDGGSYYLVVAHSDTHFKYYDGAYKNFPTDKTYVANTWYRIRMAFVASQQKFWVWVNGTNLTPAGLPLKNSSGVLLPTDGTLTMRLLCGDGAGTGQDYWLDNYLVGKYTSPEPSDGAWGGEEGFDAKNLSSKVGVSQYRNLSSSVGVSQWRNLSSSCFVPPRWTDMPTNVTVRNRGFKNLSSSIYPMYPASKDLSANCYVMFPAWKSLSSNVQVKNKGFKNLSSSFTIRKSASKNLSSSFTIRKSASIDLSSSVTLRQGDINLPSNIIVRNAGYKDLRTVFISANYLWLSGWTYRKRHIINAAAGAGTGYQVKIVVHYGAGTDSGGHVYCNSKCKTDFGDIRFTKADGTTLLDYWMESSITSDNAVFWVEVADDLTYLNQMIYVYYGNAGASTTSNGPNTFSLFDDFNDNSIDTNKWETQTNAYCLVSETSQQMRAYISNSGAGVWYYGHVRSKVAYEFGPGYAVRARAYWYRYPDTAGGANCRFRFGFGEALDQAGDDMVVQDMYGSWTSEYHYFYSYKAGVGYSATTGSIKNAWRVMEERRTSGKVEDVWDDVSKGSTTNTAYIPTINLRVGVWISRGANTGDGYVYLDWLAVRKYTDPEPAHSIWGSEEAAGYKQLSSVFGVSQYQNLPASMYVPPTSGDLSSNITVQNQGSKDLSSSLTIQKSGSADLSSSVQVDFWAVLPSSITIQQSGSADLSSSIYSMFPASKDLSANVTIQHSDARSLSSSMHVPPRWADMSSNFTVRNWSAVNLSSDVYVMFPGSKDLSSNLTVRKPGASDLSSSFTVRKPGSSDLSASVYPMYPASKDLSSRFGVYIAAKLRSSITIRNKSAAELSSSFTLRNSGYKRLSSSFTIRKVASQDLSSSLLPRAVAFKDLSSDVIIRNVGSADFRRNSVTVRKPGSIDLSSSCFVAFPFARELPSSFTIQKPGSANISAWIFVMSPGSMDLSSSMTPRFRGSSDLSSSFTIRKETSKNSNRCSFTVRASGSADLSSSFTIKKPGSADLSSNLVIPVPPNLPSSITIRKSGSLDLIADVTIRQSAAINLSSSLKLHRPYADLSSSVSIRRTAHVRMRSNVTVRNVGSANLSSSFGIQQHAYLSSSVTIIPAPYEYVEITSWSEKE